MNYLAHFYLATPETDLMFGNYIGDGVKGSDLGRYTQAVQRGIRFHRFIDSFTDDHHLVREAKKLFYPSQAKFSGVVVDVLFDHMLANLWSDYADESLVNFAQNCYATVGELEHLMPQRSAGFYRYMVSNNILEGYASEAGVTRVFEGMDSRTRFASNMKSSIQELQNHREDFELLFKQFFPQLNVATQAWRREN